MGERRSVKPRPQPPPPPLPDRHTQAPTSEQGPAALLAQALGSPRSSLAPLPCGACLTAGGILSRRHIEPNIINIFHCDLIGQGPAEKRKQGVCGVCVCVVKCVCVCVESACGETWELGSLGPRVVLPAGRPPALSPWFSGALRLIGCGPPWGPSLRVGLITKCSQWRPRQGGT